MIEAANSTSVYVLIRGQRPQRAQVRRGRKTWKQKTKINISASLSRIQVRFVPAKREQEVVHVTG